MSAEKQRSLLNHAKQINSPTDMRLQENENSENYNRSNYSEESLLNDLKTGDYVNQDFGTSKVLKPGESEHQSESNYSEYSDEVKANRKSSNYELIVRSAESEIEDAQNELLDADEKNKLIVYRKALENACSENDKLRTALVASRRKSQHLKAQNDNMKEVILELSESINFMTGGKLDQQLDHSQTQ